jgi:hypothetical protein
VTFGLENGMQDETEQAIGASPPREGAVYRAVLGWSRWWAG